MARARGWVQSEHHTPYATIGRREVDRDAPRWDLEAAVAERTPHPLARLQDGAAREADDRQTGQAEGDVDLDPDRDAVDADHGRADRLRQHERLRIGRHIGCGERRSPACSPP
jgi:hypothetical protein